MKKILLATCFALFLAGCANTRPSDDSAYQAAVSAVTQNEKVIFNNRGVWYPNQSKIVIRPVFAMPPMLDGNLTITDKAVYFMEWDDNSKEYNIVYKQSLQDIQRVKTEKFGLGIRLFIQSKTTWDGFSGPDIDKAYQHLKSVTHGTANE